jgi:biotin carboxylase
VLERELGLPAPRFVVADTLAELDARLPTLVGPVVFKPEDASGSKGISAADVRDRAACLAAFAHARAHARCGGVCIEELLEGQHISADGFIDDGRVAHMLCTDKQRVGFVVHGHVVPAPIAPEHVVSLRRQVEAVVAHVGLDVGFFDLDAVVTATGPEIIEISPRLGGNGIPLLFERAAGLLLTEASLRRAMDEPFVLACASTPRPMASWVFGAPQPGTLTAIADEHTVRARVPELEHLLVAREIGDTVRPMENGADLIGIAIFAIREDSSFTAMTGRLETALQIEVR